MSAAAFLFLVRLCRGLYLEMVHAWLEGVGWELGGFRGKDACDEGVGEDMKWEGKGRDGYTTAFRSLRVFAALIFSDIGGKKGYDTSRRVLRWRRHIDDFCEESNMAMDLH